VAASNASRQHDDDCVAGSAGVATTDDVGHHGRPTGDERALDRAGAQPMPDRDERAPRRSARGLARRAVRRRAHARNRRA
jgi:hypothetical protein